MGRWGSGGEGIAEKSLDLIQFYIYFSLLLLGLT
jgi:hypothetical protein